MTKAILFLAEDEGSGHAKALGEGILEFKLRHPTALKIYYTMRGSEIILLLIGGDKRGENERKLQERREQAITQNSKLKKLYIVLIQVPHSPETKDERIALFLTVHPDINRIAAPKHNGRG